MENGSKKKLKSLSHKAMKTAVILTNDRFISGKNPLPLYSPNHCRKMTKSTVTTGLKKVNFAFMIPNPSLDCSYLLNFWANLSLVLMKSFL